jgi:Ala-tRNA(Pro) deacylase
MRHDRDSFLGWLDAQGIAHVTHRHAPVFTVAESEGIKLTMPGVHTKNLFLEDRGGALVLVSAAAGTRIRVNALHRVLGCQRLSFGAAERMEASLGVRPGSVTAFAVINDSARAVTLVLDRALFEAEPVNFHPLLNDATTAVSHAGLMAVFAHSGHRPWRIGFDADGEPVMVEPPGAWAV